jgi:hypothetical protein
MSKLEWKDRFWRGWSANTEDRGIFAVRPIATLKTDPDLRYGDDAPAWQWEWQPPSVIGTAESQHVAMAAAVAASNASRPIEWVKSTPVYRVEEDGTERCGLIAVVSGLVLRVDWLQGERIGTIRTPAEAGWDWSVLREGRRVADGWCKTREEAQTAAELAAQAQP